MLTAPPAVSLISLGQKQGDTPLFLFFPPPLGGKDGVLNPCEDEAVCGHIQSGSSPRGTHAQAQ